MRLRQILETSGGALLVAAMLTLSISGVRIARADEPTGDPAEFARFVAHSGDTSLRGAPAPRESCGVAKVNRASSRMAELMAAMRQQAQFQAAREGRADTPRTPRNGRSGKARVVVLNNRGYNYALAPLPRLGRAPAPASAGSDLRR